MTAETSPHRPPCIEGDHCGELQCPPPTPRRQLTEGEAGRHYPHAAGETIVLGPEIFASADGQTISWRGVNYVPQRAAAEGAGA